MEKISCHKCGSESVRLENKTFANGTKHLAAFCVDCGKFLKYVQRVKDEDFVMPFGKHKGERLFDVPREYLEWMENTVDSTNLKSRIKRFLCEPTKK